jgi:hypothetical protein
LDYPNLHILEKEVWRHQGYTFIGGTLWTDMNRSDPITLMHVKGAMNDFRGITNSNRTVARQVPVYERRQEPDTWSPEDTVEDHQQMLAYINAIVQDPGSYIVVGHHAPSSRSVADWYRADTVMNGAFRSELDEFIMDRPQIRLWIHGHMHNASDYRIDQTRVVCNPRGYVGYEAVANKFELKYLEV